MKKGKVKMNKLIKLNGVKTPFEIQTITAARSQVLMKKNQNLFFNINAVGYLEDLVFECVVYPSFSTKQELMEFLLPGQFCELSEQVQELNGFCWEKERKAVKKYV